MPEKPVTTFVVSVFEKPHWRTVLTTKDATYCRSSARGECKFRIVAASHLKKVCIE